MRQRIQLEPGDSQIKYCFYPTSKMIKVQDENVITLGLNEYVIY